MPLIPMAIAGLIGMFVGGQVDDALDQNAKSGPNPLTVMIYIAGGLGIWYMFKKAKKA